MTVLLWNDTRVSCLPSPAHMGEGTGVRERLLDMMQTRENSPIRYGVVFSGNFPLQRTLEGATLADDLGFDTCWLGEDYFYQGGFTTATAVADRTRRIDIGLGVLTPLPRHPALTVMELGTLDQIAGGRLIAGYGAGVRYWMQQMRLDYRSPLSAMREAVEITRELLTGETSCYQGRYFQTRQCPSRLHAAAFEYADLSRRRGTESAPAKRRGRGRLDPLRPQQPGLHPLRAREHRHWL